MQIGYIKPNSVVLTYVILLCLTSSWLSAQNLDPSQDTTQSYWKRSFSAGVNVNQASFSSNWKGGGVNSIALGSSLKARAQYHKNAFDYLSDLNLQYGFLKNEGQSLRKTVDQIFWDNKVGYHFAKHLNAFGSLLFTSQFAEGFRYEKNPDGTEKDVLISRFMSPGFLTQSIGIEYKPVSYFWIRAGLGTLRQTFVLDTAIYRQEPKNYGVPIGKTVRNEAAFMLVADFDKEVRKNLSVKTRFQAFANYQTLDAIDTRLDIAINAKVTRYINVSFNAIVMHDNDLDPRIQISQGLALGILYQID